MRAMINYAVIQDGIVVNIAVYDHAQENEKLRVIPDMMPVAVGDHFTNGAFYRNGEKVLSYMEQIEDEHNKELAELIEEVYTQDMNEIFGDGGDE